MPDVKNIITLGIGAGPGDIHFFVLVGLDVNPPTEAPVPLTLLPRSTSLTMNGRSTGLTVRSRSTLLTLKDIR